MDARVPSPSLRRSSGSPQEADFLGSLFSQYSKDAQYPADFEYGADWTQRVRMIQANYRSTSTYHWLAHVRGEPVGFVTTQMVTVTDARFAIIENLIVAERLRNQRIGGRIAVSAAHRSRRMGASHVVASVFVERNPAAARMFRREGFRSSLVKFRARPESRPKVPVPLSEVATVPLRRVKGHVVTLYNCIHYLGVRAIMGAAAARAPKALEAAKRLPGVVLVEVFVPMADAERHEEVLTSLGFNRVPREILSL